MITEMNLLVKFNRGVDLKRDYISPGGFEMVMNGNSVRFDFTQSHSKVIEAKDCLCLFSLTRPDYNEFSDFKNMTLDDLRNVSKIKECFIYIGEPGENDLRVQSVKEISLLWLGRNAEIIKIPSKVINEYNAIIKRGETYNE